MREIYYNLMTGVLVRLNGMIKNVVSISLGTEYNCAR